MRVSFVAFTTQVGVLHGAGLQSGVGARVFRTGLRHSQVCCEASCLRAHSIVSANAAASLQSGFSADRGIWQLASALQDSQPARFTVLHRGGSRRTCFGSEPCV